MTSFFIKTKDDKIAIEHWLAWVKFSLHRSPPRLGLNYNQIPLLHLCVCVECTPLIPSQKRNGYDLLKIRLRNFCQQRDLEMSISESGPCSQVKHGLWEEERRSLVFVDKGSVTTAYVITTAYVTQPLA